jgi:HAD superfamily hydrolase (TIGR01509 family)
MASFLQPRGSRRAAILDVDGTLVDSNDAHARAWVDAFTEAGVQVDHERVRRAIGMGGDKLMPHVSGISEDSPEGAVIASRRAEIFRSRYLPHLSAFPGVRELVERLVRDGYTIAVASSAKKDELGPLLERAGIADLVQKETSSDDAERSKPDPDIVQAALRRTGVPAEAAIMLGDTPYDVDAARQAGIAIVGVECGGWRRIDLAGARDVYPAPRDLLERYGTSPFARLAAGMRDRERVPGTARIDVDRLVLIAAGVATAALVFLMLRAVARRRRDADDYDAADGVHPGLGPRDRERLRHLIDRTS